MSNSRNKRIPTIYPKHTRKEKLIKLIEELFQYTIFDKDYWESHYLKYENACISFSRLDDSDNDEMKDYLESKQLLDNPWYWHWISMLSRGDEKKDNLMKAMKMDNPFSLTEFAQLYLQDDLESQKKLYRKAADLGYNKGLIYYVRLAYTKKIICKILDDGKDEDDEEYSEGEENEEDESNEENEEKKTEEERIAIRKIFLNTVLADLEKLESYEDEDCYGAAADIYQSLHDCTNEEIFMDKLIQCRESADSQNQLVERNGYSLLKYAKKYFEVKKAYNEMTKVKEMDFNAIVSGTVGKYLN